MNETKSELYLRKENVGTVKPERFTIEYWERDKSWKFLLSKRRFLISPVADLGCGQGPLTILTSRLGFDVTGFDCIEENIRNAEKLILDTDRVRFVRCFLDRIDAPDHSFSSGILKEVLEHIIAPDIPAVLEEVRRILRPGAPLIVTVPRESLLKPMDARQHVTFFHSPRELAHFLKKHGFRIERKEFNKIYKRICVVARLPA
jgi:ubiquinone/menaquinone biosynthesis C-methylase UbiE